MKEMILIKVGELALKGLNRRTFEDVLVKNIKRSISYLGPFEVKTAQSTVYVTPLRDGADLDEARAVLDACSVSPPIPGRALLKKAWTASR